MLENLTEYVSDSPVTYLVLFLVAALDVIVPVVPSETMVVTAGVLAAAGGLVFPLVVLVAAVGAVTGDNVSYWIGRSAGEWATRRFFAGERRKRIAWAEAALAERGGYLIVIARFVPGGRTAVTLSAGLLEMPYRRFLAFDIAAGVIWGTYAASVGYFGGKTFEEDPLKGIVLALAIAFGVAAMVETSRWFRKRRRLARTS